MTPPTTTGSDRAPAGLRKAVKSVAAAVDRVRSPDPGLTILVYHRVGGGSGTEMDLPPALFDRQVAYLAEHYHPVSLMAALHIAREGPDAGLDNGKPPIVVTFDDGTADFVDHAVPALVKHGVRATLYLATDFVENQHPFPHGGTPLTWQGVREALSTGLVDVGSHTDRHVLLDRADVVVSDLDRSIELIEDRVTRSPQDFSYPMAVPASPAAERHVRARFRSAALRGTKPNPYGRTNPWRLSRSPIQVSDGMDYFARKAAGGMRLEDDLRRLVNRWRSRGAEI